MSKYRSSMKETTPAAMPPCFERWCQQFDDCWKNPPQRTGFRHYLGGLLGESERKNISQMANNSIGVVYNRLHHFIADSPWEASQINQRRLQIINKRSQTKFKKGFSLILDDSGHRKSDNFISGVDRQYIGEIGKTDKVIVTVTTHYYDGKKSLPLDIELYQHSSSLPEGKDDKLFQKNREIGIDLIDRTLARGLRPGIVLIDACYSNSTTFLKKLEERELKYLGGMAKNRKIVVKQKSNKEKETRIDELAKSIPTEKFEPVILSLEKTKTLWVATFRGSTSRLQGERTLAIVMNASSVEKATKIDYFITNVEPYKVTPEWIVNSYSNQNLIEVFYREAKRYLGFKEYQVRDQWSLERHFILVFCAYTFIICNKLTGGLQRQWGNKPLKTFADALEAFRTAMSFRFLIA